MMHTAESYLAHWATLTGKSPSEIYVPEALRPVWDCTWCGLPQSKAPVAACSLACQQAEINWARRR